MLTDTAFPLAIGQRTLTDEYRIGQMTTEAGLRVTIQLTRAVLARHAILFVDDNDWSRTVFARTVSPFVHVDLAESVQEALEMLHARRYSILVTDYRMPDMDGIELCVAARAQFPMVRRILVTAYGDLETVTDAINRGGVSHFVTKPWKHDFLIHALKEILMRVELERRVESLQDAIKQREIEVALGEQANRIVHDLKSIPLPIRTALMDLEQVRADPSLSEDARSLVDHQCTTLKNVIEHLERMLRRSTDLELSPPLRQRYRVMTALETARALVVQRTDRLQIDLQCDDPGLEFVADLTDVTRVLANLMRNAQDAVGGSINGRVTVRADHDASEVVIRIEDNGPGIRPERRETVFERGYTERKEQGGQGLGLAICRDLAILNGGSLCLDDNDSAGCRFILRLPSPIADRSSA